MITGQRDAGLNAEHVGSHWFTWVVDVRQRFVPFDLKRLLASLVLFVHSDPMNTIQARGRWGLERDVEPSDVDLPLVEIPNDVGLSLIMKTPSGWAFANQTGGHRCVQAWAEGILVPIGARGVPLDSIRSEERLDEVLGSLSKYQGHCYDGITASDADQIDTILSMHWGNHFADLVRVDRAHLADSWEAWVHVVVGSHPSPDSASWPFRRLPVREAVLTWTNSD